MAQLEAHLTTNEKVVGSNPAGGTKKYAQMGKWSNLSVCKTDIRRFESGSGLKILDEEIWNGIGFPQSSRVTSTCYGERGLHKDTIGGTVLWGLRRPP